MIPLLMIVLPVAFICILINNIFAAKYKAAQNTYEVFHCPDCRSFYYGEWDNEPVVEELHPPARIRRDQP